MRLATLLERKSAMRSFLMRPEEMRRKARPPWVGVREKGCWSCLMRSEMRLMGPATMTVKREAEVRWVR